MEETTLKEREELLSIAEAYIEQNLYKEALHIAESWLKRYSTDADANIVRCHALLKMGNLEKVHDILKEVENTVLQLSRIYHRVGDLCLHGGLTLEAIKFYGKFISLNPGSPEARDLSDKIEALKLSLDPSSAGTQVGTEADTYNNIDRVAPDFHTTTLAELYIAQGHPDMAYDVLSDILKKEPENKIVANRLKEVSAMRNDEAKEQTSYVPEPEGLIQELTRWLKNIDRLRNYAS